VSISSRRLAWGVFGVVCLCYVAGLIVEVPGTHDSQGTDWGLNTAVSGMAFVLSTFLFPLVGVLVALRQPRNAVGWVLLAIGFTWGLELVCSSYATYGLDLHRGSHRLAAVAASVDNMLWVPAIGLTGVFLLLVFPDGRLLTPRWRWLAWPSAIGMTMGSLTILLDPGLMTDGSFPNTDNPLGIEALGDVIGFARPAVVVLPLAIAGSAVSLVLRYRRSRGTERRQMKWLAAAAAAVAGIYAIVLTLSVVLPSGAGTPEWVRFLQTVALISFGLIPVSIGFAVFQYRLYDIDLIIRRTLTYSCLAAILVAIYLAGVVGLSSVLRAATGESGAPAVTLSTLLVVLVSRPIQSRIKAAIDHRFARLAYDPARALEEFSDQVRQNVDLDGLCAELVGTVSATVRPTHVTLWLRPPTERG
jgi:hypothetical protein